jgi:hypothetical protein
MPLRFSFNTDLTSSVNAPLARFASLRYIITKGGVCVTLWPLPFTLKSILRQKKGELWKTQIFHQAKNIIFKKYSKRNQNPFKILL